MDPVDTPDTHQGYSSTRGQVQTEGKRWGDSRGVSVLTTCDERHRDPERVRTICCDESSRHYSLARFLRLGLRDSRLPRRRFCLSVRPEKGCSLSVCVLCYVSTNFWVFWTSSGPPRRVRDSVRRLFVTRGGRGPWNTPTLKVYTSYRRL